MKLLAKVERYQNQSDIGQQRQSISELNIKNSGLWQNPSLNINQDGLGSNTNQELSIAISQPLDVFGQRKLNQKLAENSAATRTVTTTTGGQHKANWW